MYYFYFCIGDYSIVGLFVEIRTSSKPLVFKFNPLSLLCIYIYIYILYITYYIYTIYHVLPPASYSLLEFIRYTLYNLHSVNLYSTFKVWFTIKLQKHKSFSFVLYSMLKHTGSAGPNS